MKSFEFYWRDLTSECQDRLFDFLGGENGNYDYFPFATLEIEDEKDDVADNKKWLNVELDRDTADEFRTFLRANSIKFETSEAWDLIHFECLMNEREKEKADRFLSMGDDF